MARQRASAASSGKKRAEVFDSLHKEMEIAEYATIATGQRVRKVPKKQALVRTRKRKALEQEDKMGMMIEAEDDDEEEEEEGDQGANGNKKRKRRLRGTKVAFEDVILKSMPLGGEGNGKRQTSHKNNDDNNNDDEEDEEQTESERCEVMQEVAALGIDVDVDEAKDSNEEDDDGEENEDIEESGDEQLKDPNNGATTARKQSTTMSKPAPRQKKKNRILSRMREFSSQKIAQQHGEALSAYVKGMPEVAVEKLGQVAKAAPTAPQVYSSLGMVYESMLNDIEMKIDCKVEEASLQDASFVTLVRRQLELARKTYGSFHVASLLCKRDFVLWERSGDQAMKIANIYDDLIMMHRDEEAVVDSVNCDDDKDTDQDFNPSDGPAKWRPERKIWYDHAFSAYDSADKLRPPGVNVPCKLAEVQMNLGNYIQALSILTDLRNKANGKSSRSSMEESPSSWLLYADLMLKIGFESKKFNDGEGFALVKNSKNTFKRWLRKYSKSFDWRERRLQALCLAMEAAAGSASCAELAEWMRKRAEKYLEKNEKEDADIDKTVVQGLDDEDDENEMVDDNNGDDCTLSTANTRELSSYDLMREELVNKNKLELLKFDATTNEMNIEQNSSAYRDRIAAREDLLDAHRGKIREMALEQALCDSSNADNSKSDASGDENPSNALPMQSSCASVYEVCRLLLRQCLHLGLYDGGVIVVQSTLRYLKERALRYEMKKKRQQNSNTLMGGGDAQYGFAHDQMSDASEDSDDECFLSDDEELEDSGVLQSLKSGVLPTDINTMYSVCLLGVGGQDFVALNNLETTLQSNELVMFDKGHQRHPDCTAEEHKWIAFKKKYASPLSKTSIVAIIADVVSDRPPGLSIRRILGILRSHLKLIDQNHGLDVLLSNPDGTSHANLKKILLAAAKLVIKCDTLEIEQLNEPGVSEVDIAKSVVTNVVQTITTLVRFQEVIWSRPDSCNGSVNSESMEMLSIFTKALDVLVRTMSHVEDDSLNEAFVLAVMRSRHLLSLIFMEGLPAMPRDSVDYNAWRTFPLPDRWQTDFEKKLSIKAYNMCIACCVSHFSGWETEFGVDKLRSRDDDLNFFGVAFVGDRISGFLSDDVTSSLSQQWQRIQTILPNLESLDFDTCLSMRNEAEWCQKVVNIAAQQSENVPIYNEDNGVKALLSFSMLCLIAFDVKTNQHDQGILFRLSMSILLPITQFIIDKDVWESKIGTMNETDKEEVEYFLDESFQWMGQIKASKLIQFPTNSKPSVQRHQYQMQPQPHISLEASPRPPEPSRPKVSKVIQVPTSILLDEWNKEESFEPGNLAAAKRAMKKLDDAMKIVRKSRTLNALEQSSLDVSAALIDVASTKECHNPFLCLQQAAMYAELGSKLGSNDEPFKKLLPDKEKCTPLEALVILGRADCLRAIHFLQEAQYLCSWVISVCRLHRSHQDSTPLHDDRWKVIRVLCYVTKATIDETGHALNTTNSAWSLRKWDDVAQEEAKRGKSEALLLVGVDDYTELEDEVPKIDNAGTFDNTFTVDGGEDETVRQKESGLVADQLVDYNQLDELPIPVIDDSQINGEYDGIQVIGI